MHSIAAAAAAEAQRRGDARTGTEHLLLAILSDQTSASARAIGITARQASAALSAIDQRAMAAVGFAPRESAVIARTISRRAVPLNRAARAALAKAFTYAMRDGSLYLRDEHVLQALLDVDANDLVSELFEYFGLHSHDIRGRLTLTAV